MSPLLGFSLFPEFSWPRLQSLLAFYAGDIAAAWAGLNLAELVGLGLSPTQSGAILANKKILDLQKYQERLQAAQLELVEIFSPDYPAALKEIYDPPLVLYKKGPLSLRDFSAVAVVGTR